MNQRLIILFLTAGLLSFIDPKPGAKKAFITIDAAVMQGKIKKSLLGVNQGPLTIPVPNAGFKGDNFIDLSHYFTEAGIQSSRLDEYADVDINYIFPDFKADANDPRNYNFTLGDQYLKSIRDIGMEIVFRVGYGGEKSRNDPPSDYEKWSDIALHIIKHYNEGWANGVKWNIKYWEIWNEPSGLGWNGTTLQYCKLYELTARKIKKYNPALQVGGPSLGGPDVLYDRQFAESFIQYCSKNKVPLDFFAYHLYFRDPAEHAVYSERYRKFLDAHGYNQTKLFLTEWGWLPGSHYPPTSEELAGIDDGVADIAAIMAMQENVDMAHFYVGGGLAGWPWGLFDFIKKDGKDDVQPRKSYFAFKAYGKLAEADNRIGVKITAPPEVKAERLSALAGVSQKKDKIYFLLANRQSSVDSYNLKVNHVPWDGKTSCQVLLLDSTHNLEVIRWNLRETTKGEGNTLLLEDINIPASAICLVTMERMIKGE